NTSTGYSHFLLHLRHSPRLLPPLMPLVVQSTRESFPTDMIAALKAIMGLKTDITNAHDALLTAKISQASSANAHRSDEPKFTIGDLVYLSTAHWH
ncbi:hypothetical protein BDR04DRAFT_1030387, partial [Suillus decipiens]